MFVKIRMGVTSEWLHEQSHDVNLQKPIVFAKVVLQKMSIQQFLLIPFQMFHFKVSFLSDFHSIPKVIIVERLKLM